MAGSTSRREVPAGHSVLLWLLSSPEKIPAPIRATLASRSNDLCASAVSAMEVATKVRLGTLPDGAALVDSWSARIGEIGAVELPLSAQHAVRAGLMPWRHRDPFDRLLVAQALLENLALVSTDPAMTEIPGLRLTSW